VIGSAEIQNPRAIEVWIFYDCNSGLFKN
jgi:hypothetical protein